MPRRIAALTGKLLSAAMATAVIFGGARLSSARAQSQPSDWETAAGGKMSFDVASVKQNKSDDQPHTNFPLDAGNTFSANGGLFTATSLYLGTYIRFAYKLPPDQYKRLDGQLPKWAHAEFFDIQARAAGNPNKDQMRLMMQALLADRFGLRVHTETQQVPVFAVLLEKAGRTGPQLVAHPETVPCADPASVSGRSLDISPLLCGVLLGKRSAATTTVRYGMRKVPMDLIASTLSTLGNFGRPVLDQTGLSGNFDFTIEWATEAPPNSDLQVDPNAPTFLEALKDQLGLKLDSTTGPVSIFVIDHIEEPSAN